MQYDFREISLRAKQRFALSLKGVHGLAHWQRVQENGLKLAKYNGADKDVVRLFSFLHDCCRENDSADPDHGPRAAEFAKTLRDELIIATDEQFERLVTAIRDHTHELHHVDITIATCWDADRLDIGRVGMRPERRYLNTKIAQDEWIMKWAYKRSTR